MARQNLDDLRRARKAAADMMAAVTPASAPSGQPRRPTRPPRA
ncbi:hypothetical protein V6Z72_05665 [Cereibacter sphaeroides]